MCGTFRTQCDVRVESVNARQGGRPRERRSGRPLSYHHPAAPVQARGAGPARPSLKPTQGSRAAWASLARQRQAFDHDDGWSSVQDAGPQACSSRRLRTHCLMAHRFRSGDASAGMTASGVVNIGSDAKGGRRRSSPRRPPFRCGSPTDVDPHAKIQTPASWKTKPKNRSQIPVP
jgi:hypothetical protein